MKNPSDLKAFAHLDRDPEQVGDQMAREMTREDAALLLLRAEQWLRDVREWEAARRWRRANGEVEKTALQAAEERFERARAEREACVGAWVIARQEHWDATNELERLDRENHE